MIYGYARCSTNERKQDINRQVRELKQQGATDKTIYLEYESGMKTNRAELAKLLDVVKAGDTILTTEVSRIDRQAEELFLRLVKQMAAAEGISETLKASNPMEWVGRIKSCRNRATEIVCHQVIYT